MQNNIELANYIVKKVGTIVPIAPSDIDEIKEEVLLCLQAPTDKLAPRNFKIEKDIPIPKAARGPANKYPFKKMVIDDSFEYGDYNNSDLKRVCNAARNWAKMAGLKWKFEGRLTEDDKLRIWRTK